MLPKKTQIRVNANFDDQAVFLGGEIKLAKYAVSGSDELVENVIAALGKRKAVLLANHGAVGIGRTMREAFTACELLEKTAKIYFYALVKHWCCDHEYYKQDENDINERGHVDVVKRSLGGSFYFHLFFSPLL